MTSPYRENQYKNNDPFDVLDHNELRQKSDEHKLLLRKTAIELCNNSSLKSTLKKVKLDLTKTGSAWINTVEVIRYDRARYLSEEQAEIDQTIISWFVEKLELKGFVIICRVPHILIKFSEK